jgi:hypothetical protein
VKVGLTTAGGVGRDSSSLIAVSRVFGIGFFAITVLLRVLYVLCLGYGPEAVGLCNVVGSLGPMVMSLSGGGCESAVVMVSGVVLMPVVGFLAHHVQYA